LSLVNLTRTPLFFRLQSKGDCKRLTELKQEFKPVVFDEIASQLEEWVRMQHPQRKLTKQDKHLFACQKLEGMPLEEYGVWVYYPWSNRLVHILDEQEFVALRTSRNRNKITLEEQCSLSQKRIGVIGLSVGQCFAFAAAQERICGELILADFDVLELSNLNRIRTGVHNIGVPKTVQVAREIYETDPFITVHCIDDGLQPENLDVFFKDFGPLDLIIEECDSLDIKILARKRARELGIPVVMDTSDRGMLDVERFDLEPGRPIFHGLMEHLSQDVTQLRDLSNEEKIPYMLPILGADTCSDKMMASLMEVDETLTTWPQLASSVVMGGAVAVDVARRILLNEFHASGRFFIDPETLICDPIPTVEAQATMDFKPTENSCQWHHLKLPIHSKVEDAQDVAIELITAWVEAAIKAPSGGNSQPWKFIWSHKTLHLLHDEARSHSFLDYGNAAAYLALGAAAENLCLAAAQSGYRAMEQIHELHAHPLVASFVFKSDADAIIWGQDLFPAIPKRETNRLLSGNEKLAPGDLKFLEAVVPATAGIALTFATQEDQLQVLTQTIAASERLRMMHPQSHADFVREIRWSEAENKKKRDGIDLETIDLSASDKAGLRIAKRWSVMEQLIRWRGGKALEKLTRRTLQTASAVGLISCKQWDVQEFYQSGRVLERIWLQATIRGLALQPVTPITYMFCRHLYAQNEGFNELMQTEVPALVSAFYQVFPSHKDLCPVFLFKLARNANHPKRSLRRWVTDVLAFD
jgi:molybdopterin/thiamine biosynthesis adenylyltransferase